MLFKEEFTVKQNHTEINLRNRQHPRKVFCFGINMTARRKMGDSSGKEL